MPEKFVARYKPEEKKAAAEAYEDRGIKPYRRVVELAAAGELTYNGVTLDPFEMPVTTLRDLVYDLRRQRKGAKSSTLSQQPPRDAIEQLRRRLVNVADAELRDLEAKGTGKRDMERLRQIVRVVREAAAIPGPTDPRPKPPGSKAGGQRDGAETTGGLGGAILADHRATANGAASTHEQGPRPQPSQPPEGTTGERDHGDGDAAQRDAAHDVTSQHEAHDDGSPGSLVRGLAERVALAQREG